MTQQPAPDSGYQKVTLNVRLEIERTQPIMHVNFARVSMAQSTVYIDFGMLYPNEVQGILANAKEGETLTVDAVGQVRIAMPIEAVQQMQSALAAHMESFLNRQAEGVGTDT